MRSTLILLVVLTFYSRGTQAECLEPAARVVSRWKNGKYYKGEIDSITNRVNVLFDNGVRMAYNPRDNVDIVVDRIPEHNEIPWGSQVLVNRPRSRAFEIGYIRDIKNGRFVILYENGDQILHTLDQIRSFNKSRICDEPAYLGCFRDILPRHLQVYIPTRPATIGACVDTCKSQGFSIAALRNSDLCFCGNSYSKSYQVREKECDMPCYDNSYEVCGGFMTFSQYWTGIVNSAFGEVPPKPGLQKHFIPSNHPIPWELLTHARSKHPSRYTAVSARNRGQYQAYPWKGNNVAPFRKQQTAQYTSYPSQGKPFNLGSTYQKYQQLYGAKPYSFNYGGRQQQQTFRYHYRFAGSNPRAAASYGNVYQRQAYRWPYNYNYNNYRYRNYNYQNSVTKGSYNGYPNLYQRRPAPRPSPQEEAKLIRMLKQLFQHVIGRPSVDLRAPRFMGCFQDSEGRDLPTAVEVRPLTVGGCVTKCGQSGFSMAGLQSSIRCFCGMTYSRYGRLRDEQCTMRCTGNYKETCGGFMMNSIYYTGVGQAIPYGTKYGARTQKITFVKNNPPGIHAGQKPLNKPKPRLNKSLTLHKSYKKKAPQNKTKEKKASNDTAKKPTHLKQKDKDESRPMTMRDYGKLRKILQTLSRWQRQPHDFRHGSDEVKHTPSPSYKQLRKVLEDMTPQIVKKIAKKLIAEDMNRTRLSDLKPLNAVHSLDVNMAATKIKNDRETGFKRVKVNSLRYKNWSQKTNKTATKTKNKQASVVLEPEAQTVNPSDKSSGTQDSSTQVAPSVKHEGGNKTLKLPSFIPIAEKERKHGLNNKKDATFLRHNKENTSKHVESSLKNIAVSDVQSNKRNFVHFVITDENGKKDVIPKTKNESLQSNSLLNETVYTEEGNSSFFQEKESSGVTDVTTESDTVKANKTHFKPLTSSTKFLVPSKYIDEVFEINTTPSSQAFVNKDKINYKKNILKTPNKFTKTINLAYRRTPHNKILHVEAKWNGQIKVKANWKDIDELEPEPKGKESPSWKKNKVKPKKDENSGEEEGNDESKFDDIGSRNDLIWRRNRSLKDKEKRISHS